jgi:hypothetical protein
MFFRKCLPVFNLLEGRIVFFLTPMPRYLTSTSTAVKELITPPTVWRTASRRISGRAWLSADPSKRTSSSPAASSTSTSSILASASPARTRRATSCGDLIQFTPNTRVTGGSSTMCVERLPSFKTGRQARRGRAIRWDRRRSGKTWLYRDLDGWLMFPPTSWFRKASAEAVAYREAAASGGAATSYEVGEEVSLEVSPTESITWATEATAATSRTIVLHCFEIL